MTDATRSILITDHLALVRPVAVRAARRWPRAALDELLAAGQWGLVDAAQRFDPAACVRPDFPSFAKRRIWGAIIDHVRSGGLVGGPYRPGRSYEASYWSLDQTDDEGVPRYDVLDQGDTPETQCVDGHDRAAGHALVCRGLAGLSATDRTLLIERYVGGLSFVAMGRRRACSESVMFHRHAAVLTRLRRVCGLPAKAA